MSNILGETRKKRFTFSGWHYWLAQCLEQEMPSVQSLVNQKKTPIFKQDAFAFIEFLVCKLIGIAILVFALKLMPAIHNSHLVLWHYQCMDFISV